MEFFVGACWHGEFSDGESTDIHCLRPMYGGLYVRDNHIVSGPRGPYGGETVFSWNAESKSIEYTYWDTSGGVSKGKMVATKDGLTSPVESYTYSDGRELKMRTSWVITGPDTWRQQSEAVGEEKTQLLWSIDYKRMPLDYGPTPLSEKQN